MCFFQFSASDRSATRCCSEKKAGCVTFDCDGEEDPHATGRHENGGHHYQVGGHRYEGGGHRFWVGSGVSFLVLFDTPALAGMFQSSD